MLIMKTLMSFINESSENKNIYKQSVRIVQFLGTKLGQEYVDFDGQNYANNDGTFFGFLFTSKTDSSAIRINWKGETFHSINFWIDWNMSKDPTYEITTENTEPGKNSFTKLLPDIGNVLKNKNTFADEKEKGEELEESVISEKKIQYNDFIFSDKNDLIIKLYEEDKTLEDIQDIVNMPTQYIKELISKYLYGKGGKVSEISTAVGLTDQEVRGVATLPIVDSDEIEYDSNIKFNAGLKETILPTKIVKKYEDYLDETKFSDPDLVFEELDSYVTLAAKKILPTLFISGQGDIGKKYNAEIILEQFGKKYEDWIKVTGKLNAKTLFNTLWENKDSVILFNDCDGVFKDPVAVNLLKMALEGVNQRDIVWEKNDTLLDTLELNTNEEIESACQEWSDDNNGKDIVPNHFIFNGGIVFISKLNKEDVLKADPDLLNSCTYVDIVESAGSTIKRLETELPNLKVFQITGTKDSSVKDITKEDIKNEVFDYISSDEFLKSPKVRGKVINYRVFQAIYKLKYANLDNWKSLAFSAV